VTDVAGSPGLPATETENQKIYGTLHELVILVMLKGLNEYILNMDKRKKARNRKCAPTISSGIKLGGMYNQCFGFEFALISIDLAFLYPYPYLYRECGSGSGFKSKLVQN
jgi:hypothetical protein